MLQFTLLSHNMKWTDWLKHKDLSLSLSASYSIVNNSSVLTSYKRNVNFHIR